MNTCINKMLSISEKTHPKLKQWLWFCGLWLLGLGCVTVMTLPIKFLIKFCQ